MEFEEKETEAVLIDKKDLLDAVKFLSGDALKVFLAIAIFKMTIEEIGIVMEDEKINSACGELLEKGYVINHDGNTIVPYLVYETQYVKRKYVKTK